MNAHKTSTVKHALNAQVNSPDSIHGDPFAVTSYVKVGTKAHQRGKFFFSDYTVG